MKSGKKFPEYRQLDQMDCGPTCLRIISQYYGKHYSLQRLREETHITRHGVNLKGISEAAEKIGFRTLGAKLTFEQLDEEAILPCILHWNQNHFVVLPPQNYNRNKKSAKILIADPAHGLIKVSKDTFLKSWSTYTNGHGIVLLLEPSPTFYDSQDEAKVKPTMSIMFRYLKPYRKYITQLFLGMIVASLLALIAPFLTQSMVDFGINQQNFGFVKLILLSQLALFFGNIAIEMIRGWLLLHMSTRINISIISDFLIKLMKLPIRFFDTKMIGDITQRVSDHSRIEQFISTTSLTTLFSFINLLIFSAVLGIYSVPILMIFLIGSLLSIAWINFFMKRRRELDYARFQNMTNNQNSIYEIITGMQEIKMNDSETMHRWGWEKIQAKLFGINIKSLSLEQYQIIGSHFFTQLKNILISYISAKEVLDGNITFGMMLSISFISGQMNSPIDQLLTFFRAAQDAKISLERLSEIHLKEDEEKENEIYPDNELEVISNDASVKGLSLKNVSFQYGGSNSPFVLKDVNLEIPEGKITAIVGASGSGKTTLMKILLKFYEPTTGSVSLNSIPLDILSAKWWRKNCGVVLSDGYIFSNTVAKNISVSDDTDTKRLLFAVKIANLESFINELPNRFSTKIGNTGSGISSGQRQRILIARAVYKEPKFIFLDEATSTLDANNEKIIVDNLAQYYAGKTVVIIAHRLSTVQHSDQVIVLDKGEIVEKGNHASLIAQKGAYYSLVKNQLELGA